MTGLFAITHRGDGVASVQIATDEEPYLGPKWVGGFSSALAGLTADAAIRAVILEGSEQYFSAGASRIALVEASERGAPLAYAAHAARALLDAPLPIIAAVAGHALGGGLLVALWCDGIVLAEEGLYAANFMQLGLTPGMGATHVIGEAFGEPLGRELLYTGRMLTGREIRDAYCPLSHAVVPRARVLDRAVSIAREMAEASRESVVLLKQNLAGRRREALERALEAETAAHAHLFANPATAREIERRYPARTRLGSTDES